MSISNETETSQQKGQGHSGACVKQGLGQLARQVPKTIPLIQQSMWVSTPHSWGDADIAT